MALSWRGKLGLFAASLIFFMTPGCGLSALVGTVVAISTTKSSSSGGIPAPSVTSVSPGSGSHGGGTTVTIAGANFSFDSTVTIGGIAATSVSVQDGATLTCTTPRSTGVGAVDVTVTSPQGGSGTLAGGFVYMNGASVAVVSSIASPQAQNIVFSFTLAQPASDLIDVAVDVDDGAGSFAAAPASSLVSGGLTSLSSSPAGVLHTLTFDSRVLFANQNATSVRIRVTPTDEVDQTVGTPGVSNGFSIQNNSSPVLRLVQNASDAFDVVVSYGVLDPDPADTISVVSLQWSDLSTGKSGPITLSTRVASQGVGAIPGSAASGLSVKTVWDSLTDLGFGNNRLVTVSVTVSDGKNAPVTQTSQPFFVSNGPVADQSIVPVSGFNDGFAVGDVTGDGLADIIACRAGDAPSAPGQFSFLTNLGRSFQPFKTFIPSNVAVPGVTGYDPANPWSSSAPHPSEGAVIDVNNDGLLDFIFANDYWGPDTNNALYKNTTTVLTFAGEDGVANGFANVLAHQVTGRYTSVTGAGPNFAAATVYEAATAPLANIAPLFRLTGQPASTFQDAANGNPSHDNIGWFTQQLVVAPITSAAPGPSLVALEGVARLSSALTGDVRGCVLVRPATGPGQISSSVFYLDPTDMGLLPTQCAVADLLSSSRAALTGALVGGGLPAPLAAPLGSPDIVVVNTGDDSLTFYFAGSLPFGAGQPPGYVSFKLPLTSLPGLSALPPGDTIGIAVGDLNGDHANDFVIIGQLSKVALCFIYDTNPAAPGSLLAATGGLFPFRIGGIMKGAVPGPTTLGVLPLPEFQCKRPAIADVTGDGLPDIIVPSLVSDEMLIFVNAGNLPIPGATNTPQFTFTRFAADLQPYQVAALDLNGDGRADIVCANHFSIDFSIYYQTSPGTLDERFLPVATGQSPGLITAGDVLGTGAPQVIVPLSGQNQVVVYGRGGGGLVPVNTFSTAFFGLATEPFDAEVGDVTGTGKLDFIAVPQIVVNPPPFPGLSGGIEIFRGGVGMIAPIQTGTFNNAALAAAIGDLDGDGVPDMALTTPQQQTGSITIFKGAPGLTYTKSALNAASARQVKIVDLDGDGHMDLVVTVTDGVDIWWGVAGALPTGAASQHVDTFTTFDIDPVGLSIADLNHDGRLDLAVGGFVNSNGGVCFQTSPRTFQVVPLLVGAPPTSVVTGDLNGDGLPDLVMCWTSLNQVAVYYQNPTPTGLADALLAPVTYSTANTPYGAVVVDVDGDGKNDLVVSCKGANSLNIFLQR